MPILNRTLPVELRGVTPAVHPEYKLEKKIEKETKADMAMVSDMIQLDFKYHRFEILTQDDDQAKAYRALKKSMVNEDRAIMHDTVIEHRYMVPCDRGLMDVVIVEYYEGVNESSPGNAKDSSSKESPKSSLEGDD